MATVLTYLGAPEEGGETIFPKANNLKVKPQVVRSACTESEFYHFVMTWEQGDAVLFFDQKPDTSNDGMSLHGSEPVISGAERLCYVWSGFSLSMRIGLKYAMTKWIRQGPSGNYYADYMNDEERADVTKADRAFYAARGWAYPSDALLTHVDDNMDAGEKEEGEDD